MKNVLYHNPKAKFLMENVRMKKEFEDYITEHTEKALGIVHKHLINSSLVSAQSRKRFYWTNIEGIEQPKDKGLVLQDVLEDGVADIVINQGKETYKSNVDKSHCLMARDYKGFGNQRMTGVRPCLNSGWTPQVFDKPTYRKLTPVECERLQTVPDNYTEGVSNTQRYKMLGNGWTVDVIAHIFKGLKNV
jgi:site-specific DNA-cytosine methylase